MPAFRRFFANLGPGLITGAADDDPSGISTYSVAGAAFGYLPLWTSLLLFPLMSAVQLMCARLGLVTGLGLAGVIRRRYSRSVLWAACSLLVVANVINIAADLGGMAAATTLVTGIPPSRWVPIYTLTMAVLLVVSSYRLIARVFKWLTLVLLAYVATAFVAHVDWGAALRAILVPHIEWSRPFFAVMVALFGTTISPYLFFWQAAQEVEELNADPAASALKQDPDGARRHLRRIKIDTYIGMGFSNLIALSIMITGGAVFVSVNDAASTLDMVVSFDMVTGRRFRSAWIAKQAAVESCEIRVG